jgi:glycosyltransferase involved in cell wall biosynthesis
MMQPSKLLYRSENYSFDKTQADDFGARRRTRLRTALEIALGSWTTVELNEPTMVKLWPTLSLYIVAARLRPYLRRHPVVLVSYAIDNADVPTCVRRRLRLPRALTKTIVRALTRQFDRIAFGTKGAYLSYLNIDPRLETAVSTKIFDYVPTRCSCGDFTSKSPNSVLFVSALEERKGIQELMASWDRIGVDRAHLTIIGKGPLRTRVESWAAKRDNVDFIHDPPREFVHKELRRNHTVVLPSQPQDCWREQVGLPIAEGLAHGCAIVTTSETGIADWLVARDHIVIEDSQDVAALHRALTNSIATEKTPQQIVDDLPRLHSRVQADDWLRR